MAIYGFWNNKGGTGKTSLAFQLISTYAYNNRNKNVLVIDLCPQANLSEFLLGGLTGNGGKNLSKLYTEGNRLTVGGYFQERFTSPFAIQDNIDVNRYITKVSLKNPHIPANIDLFAGDPIVEIQTNAIATLANTQIPSQNTWMCIIDWIKDFIDNTNSYSDVFIDLNPSFSIYTQIGLSICDYLVIPVMADDSSRRALKNVFSLVYGINISPLYNAYSFSTRMKSGNRALPKIKMILNNRLTQYVGTSSAYRTVLKNIKETVKRVAKKQPECFEEGSNFNSFFDIRDFGTTGVIAFAKGMPFYLLEAGNHNILGKTTQLNQEYINLCQGTIDVLLGEL